MRKVTLLGVVVLLITGAVLAVVSRPDLLDLVGVGGSSVQLRKLTRSFLEDIQFKDFAKAAGYHSPDEQEGVDIPYLLERLFMIKPEALDIMEYEILFVDIDSSGLRARTKARVKFKNLLQGKIEDRELVLYWDRTSPEAPWHMKLESSLRNLDADKKKKH